LSSGAAPKRANGRGAHSNKSLVSGNSQVLAVDRTRPTQKTQLAHRLQWGAAVRVCGEALAATATGAAATANVSCEWCATAATVWAILTHAQAGVAAIADSVHNTKRNRASRCMKRVVKSSGAL